MRRPSLSDERGFTLPELLITMLVGTIVLMAALMVLDRSFTASGEIADRTDALQRARTAMNRITTQLRSQICVGQQNDPIVAGTGDSVTFYADLSDGSSSSQIKRRTLTYNPSTDSITESVIAGSGTYPNLTFTAAPVTSTILTKVEPIMDGTVARPIFRYYGYKTGTTNGELEQLGVPLAASSLPRVAVVKVGLRAFAERPIADDSDSTVLENDVYVRLAVPTQLQDGPVCA